MMRIEEFDYSLPKELIAQEPKKERASSRLLVLDRSGRSIRHSHFVDIEACLREKDLLVLNDTKVFPARIAARKGTGGTVDILLTEPVDERRWLCLVNGLKRSTDGTEVFVGDTVVRLKAGTSFWTAEFPEAVDVRRIMTEHGRMPLPNYIKRGKNGDDSRDDYERYQTVYAREEGSIAAPTAGLHFDEGLLGRIAAAGVGIARVTLHIGVGTFFLIKSEDVEGHVMHREFYTIPAACADAVRRTKEKGGRVIAVGTSAVRTLESAWSHRNGDELSGYTELYIYPGYRFNVVDALITNFHLPRSTPLMLVSAFAGTEAIGAAYREAIEQRYRFYSYGDAMFIS
jgi:S-adenosylmethionine:tRNA ribosyltransferase-isomerase